MKQIFYTVLFVFSVLLVNAQSGTAVATDMKVNRSNGNLMITWSETMSGAAEGSWQVQASADGKTFSTIGLVWGQDPKAANGSYAFKQDLHKIQPGYSYFRVLYVASDNHIHAGKAVGFSK